MDEPSDTLFIEMAVAKGYVNRAHVEEALNIERATEADGEGRRFLRGILADEGWMTRAQITDVDTQIQSGSTHTGKIEGYRVLSKIGQGGMGTVYKAEREATGETVALKVLPRRMAQKGDFVERFLREARAASRIKSAHLVKTVDVGFSGGYYYFAMEYVEGESVDTTISIDGAMDELKAVRIAHQMALALRDAERAGMVHRDIKPGNIIVTEDGVAKLTDFGLARETADDSVTQAGITLGTPNYMSPEQAKAVRALDVRSDIYSLGVTFYHMVTGSVPFHGDTSLLTMLKHLNEQPVAPITRRPGLSQGCNDVILKMLVKDRADRYRNADELITDLTLVTEGKPPQFAESTAPQFAPAGDALAAGPSDASRFVEEIRRHSRVRWFKTGAMALFFALAVVLVYVLFLAGGGKGPPGTKPAVNVKETHAVLVERNARTALGGARKFAARNPDALVAIVERYTTVETDHRNTSVGGDARRLRAEAQKKLDAAIAAALESCRAAAEAQVEQGRFAEAMAAYDAFPDALRTEQAAALIQQAKRALTQRADAARREAGAAERLAAARQTRGDHKRTAQTLWELVRGYANTEFYAAHRSEAEALLIEAETAHLTVDKALAVKPAAAAGGLSELRYDFRDAAQAEDWPTVWQTRSLGRWLVRPGPGAEMTADSGTAYFKIPVKGDFRAELEVRDGRAASVRFRMPDPAASPKTSGYRFDWKRSGAGAVSTVSYAGTQLGREKRAARFRTVGAVKFTLEVKGGVLTIWVGNDLAHRVTMTGAERSGYLVLAGFTAGARLSSIVLRCNLDRDWLQKEFVDPIKNAEIERIRWAMTPNVPLLEGRDAAAWSLSAPAHWTFAATYVSAAAGADCEMITGDPGWRDVVFGAKVLLGTRTGTARLLFRWTGSGKTTRGYYVELTANERGRPGRVRLYKAAGKKAEMLKESTLSVVGIEWYDVVVEARGARFRVLVRGREVLAAEDVAAGAGRVGLASLKCGARFSDITAKVVR